MEVVSSRGRPQQLHHAALGLKDSINGGGQAIIEEFDQGDGEMMALPAGSFSLHHTLCRHRSAPNRAAHRRVGIGISYIPAHCRLTGTVRMCAPLVRGRTSAPFRLIAAAGGRIPPRGAGPPRRGLPPLSRQLRRADRGARSRLRERRRRRAADGARPDTLFGRPRGGVIRRADSASVHRLERQRADRQHAVLGYRRALGECLVHQQRHDPIHAGASRLYHEPVLAMLVQGSAGASASPACNSSREMPSGVRIKAMRPSRGGRLIVTP